VRDGLALADAREEVSGGRDTFAVFLSTPRSLTRVERLAHNGLGRECLHGCERALEMRDHRARGRQFSALDGLKYATEHVSNVGQAQLGTFDHPHIFDGASAVRTRLDTLNGHLAYYSPCGRRRNSGRIRPCQHG
jgi:hypothetical protein